MSNFVEFGIFMSLLDGKLHKAKDLAEKFEISTKTVYRHANKLVYSGFPLTTFAGKNGGICLAKKFQCQTWFFSESELSYIKNIVASSNISPATSTIICAKINQLVEKEDLSKTKRESNVFIIDSGKWFSKKPDSLDNYQNIVNACINNLQMKIVYGTNENPRIINPYCIVQKEGAYYVYAYCNTKQEYRLFKLCRMKECKPLLTQFERQQINLESMPWNKSKNQTNIIIKTSKYIAQDISSWTTCKKLQDDYYSFDAIFNDGLVHKLMEYGNQIKVIKPQELVNKIINECQIITQNYV